MRRLSYVLAAVMWLAPVMQVFAGTMAEAHCRAQGHISATAPDAAHDPTHAQHHDGEHAMHAGAAHTGHGASQQTEDAGQCKCGCICNLACAAGAALAPTLMTAEVPTPEHFRVVSGSTHPHSVHTVLQRPPISS